MKNKICFEYNISNNDIKISNAVMKYLIKQINENDTNYLLATAIHHCSPDTYDVKYEIFNNDEFKIVYKVNGPAKNYISNTYFKRNN
jgi:hypothetical protein